VIVVLIGLSGSGKSFVANILHREFGFEWIRSDQIRKEMAGIEPTQKVKVGFSEGIYSEEWTRRVYERMLDLAEEKLKEGKKRSFGCNLSEGLAEREGKGTIPFCGFHLGDCQRGRDHKKALLEAGYIGRRSRNLPTPEGGF
jgi:hypothetical protein